MSTGGAREPRGLSCINFERELDHNWGQEEPERKESYVAAFWNKH